LPLKFPENCLTIRLECDVSEKFKAERWLRGTNQLLTSDE
jgi:hypothetical protein